MAERDILGRFIKGHKQLNSGRTQFKKGVRIRLGSKHSEFSKQKMSKSKKGHMPSNIEFLVSYERPRGEKSHMWKGGKSDESKIWRRRVEYISWRNQVFERDRYTCQKCLKQGGKIVPHHIRNFAEEPSLRFEVSNGTTLCVEHHKEFHRLFGRRANNKNQIDKYIQNNKASF